jgi:hypothetical protein
VSTCKPWCKLVEEHAGDCDPRPEPVRMAVLIAAIDSGVPDEKLEAHLEVGRVGALSGAPPAESLVRVPAWPDPSAPREAVQAFLDAQPKRVVHEAPPVDNGPSLVCNACGVVRVPLFKPFCEGCTREMLAAGVGVP